MKTITRKAVTIFGRRILVPAGAVESARGSYDGRYGAHGAHTGYSAVAFRDASGNLVGAFFFSHGEEYEADPAAVVPNHRGEALNWTPIA